MAINSEKFQITVGKQGNTEQYRAIKSNTEQYRAIDVSYAL